MTFAEKLRELRDAQGLSEAKLADAAGIPYGTLHDYGLGRRKPAFDVVVKIAKALGTDCRAFAECEFTFEGHRGTAAPIPTAAPARRTGRKVPGRIRKSKQ